MTRLYLTGAVLIVATFLADVWWHVDYRVAANASLVYMAALVTIFTVRYGWRSNWRANTIGKVFLAKGIAFSLVLWQTVVATWIDTDYPYRQHVRFIIYSLGAIAYAAMVVTLWMEQRNDKRQPVE